MIRKSLFNKIAFLLVAVTIVSVAQPANAITKDNYQVKKQALQVTNVQKENFDFKVNIVSDSEVHYTTIRDGRKVECIASKDTKNVHFTYLVDGVNVLNKDATLEFSTELGQQIKNNYTNQKVTSEVTSEVKFGVKSEINLKKIGEGNNSVIGGVDDRGGYLPTGDFYFDNVVFTPKSQYKPYDHPDRDYYSISPYSTTSINGTISNFIQINSYDSNSILQTPAWAVGGALGALVGILTTSNLGAALIGAVIGSSLGAIFGGQVNRITDENGCIWFAMDKNPETVNLGTWWAPSNFMRVRYIAVGPFSKTDYYHPLSSPLNNGY